jgi:hypothetical protein
MQQFLGAGGWEDEAILRQHQRLVDEAVNIRP